MKRVAASVYLILLLTMLLPKSPAAPDRVVVGETSAIITVDGYLNMTAEWNGSVVITWRNPLYEGTESDTVYMLRNDTHYLFAAKLYDPDPTADDEFIILVHWGSITYRYVICEGSTTPALYNVTDGEATLDSNATVVATLSSFSEPWVYIEAAIPKDEWNSSTEVYLYFKHRHTFKIDTVSWYPLLANETDPSTWLLVKYWVPPAHYWLRLTFRDRDSNLINYLAGWCYAEVKFLNGTYFTTLVPTNSTIDIALPPENYTITFYVFGVPVYNTTIEVEANTTATHVLENLKRAVTGLGDVVATVEVPGEVGSIYLAPERQMAMLITNTTRPVALRLYARIKWNYTFVAVLNALNFTYDPYARSLLACAPPNFSGMMMIGAPEGYPVFHFANATLRGYVFNHELEELCAWITRGTFKIYRSRPPFAVTLNNTALRKGLDYWVDALNVTTLRALSGELRIYYRNPTKVEVITCCGNTASVIIATPYRFRGRYTLRVWRGTSLIKSTSATFTSAVPATVIEVPLGELETGNYTVEVEVVDLDSSQVLGTVTTEYEVEAAPAPAEEVSGAQDFYLLLIALAVLTIIVVLVVAALRAAKEFMARRRGWWVRVEDT